MNGVSDSERVVFWGDIGRYVRLEEKYVLKRDECDIVLFIVLQIDSFLMGNNKRIAKNTILLYFRLFITIAIQLYSVPIILRLLGVADYGLYNVVGGITALFSFVGGAMISGVQRFFSYAIGQKNQKGLRDVFNTATTIFVIFSLIAILLFETIGVWFLNYKMVIEPNRLWVANWVFQFSIFSFIISLSNIPYYSVIIAHEKIDFYAYMSIITCLFKLAAVLLLQIIDYDLLFVYALLLLLFQLLERIIYQIYCSVKFAECRKYKFSYEKEIGYDLLIYSFFNTIGTIATILRKQGLNIIMNLFFGTLINAAHAIAIQINGIIEQFINNLYLASRPQITKYYAENNFQEMWKLTFRTCKLSYFLLMVIGVITIIEIPTILDIWLHDYPEITVHITRALIIGLLIETMTNQLTAVFQAYNRIKKFQLYSSSVLLLYLPTAYIALRINDDNPMIVYIIQIAFSIIYIALVIRIAKYEIDLNVRDFLVKILLREILVSLIVFLLVYFSRAYLLPSFLRVVVSVGLSIVYSIIIIYFIGCDTEERGYIHSFVLKKFKS